MGYTKYGHKLYSKSPDFDIQYLGRFVNSRIDEILGERYEVDPFSKETIRDVFNTLSAKQKMVVYALIGMISDPSPALDMSIKYVIFNPPATIILWKDDTKTIVKCSPHDTFDPEKGLAMAIAKKIFGVNGKSYNNQIFKKWIPDFS